MADRHPIVGDEDPDPYDRGPGRAMPAICDPKHILHRVVVLCFMCFLGFGKLRSLIFHKKCLTERIQVLTARLLLLVCYQNIPY